MKSVSLVLADGRSIADDVRIADTLLARSIGLLSRRVLQAHEGLLLLPGGSVHTIGMRFPIDVVFLDRRMRIVNLTSNLAPHRFCLAPPRTASVLQLAAGRIAAIELMIGMYVVVRSEEDESAAAHASPCPRARPAQACLRPPVQFSLRLPLQRCARVDSTLGCAPSSPERPGRRAAASARAVAADVVLTLERQADASQAKRAR